MSYEKMFSPEFEAAIDAKLVEAFEATKIVQNEIDIALANGREVEVILLERGHKDGDIVSIRKLDTDNETIITGKARILNVSDTFKIDVETGESSPVSEALCIILKDDDFTPREELEDLYGEAPKPVVETVAPRSLFCEECGANRVRCEQNQEYFGVHLNEPVN